MSDGFESRYILMLKLIHECSIMQAELQIGYVTDAKVVRNDRDRREALRHLPTNLDATYAQILMSALNKYPQRESEIKQTLQWLAVSISPLTKNQLAEVISIRPQDTHLDFSGIYEPHDVIAPISQLVTHEADTILDFEKDQMLKKTTVHLQHLAVKRFLTGNDSLNSSASIFHFNEEDSHALLARVCLQYLSFSDFEVDPESLESVDRVKGLMERYTFLSYAATYWATHLRMAGLSRSEEVVYQAKRHLLWFTDPDACPGRFRLWKTALKLSRGTLDFATHSSRLPHECK